MEGEKGVIARVLAACLLLALAASAARAQAPQPTYVQFEPVGVKGALYRPDPARERDVGVLVIHRVNNFLGHLAAWQLAERGFIVLAMNSRFENNEASVIWEVIAQDVKTGVEYLRKQRGVRKVVLFGHSGGAATLSFYQAVAEQGTSFCSNPQKLTVCGTELANLPKADGLILVDASLGNPVGLLRGLNPAVKVEGDPASIDPSLDPFNPANGFDPGGSTYSDQFKQKYYAAQSARMNRLIAMAIDQVSKFGTAGAPFPDDNPFLIVRAAGARLIDNTESTATVEPRKHLKNNGSVVTEIVKSSGPPATAAPEQNATYYGGARLLTLRSFLTANAIKSTNSVTAIDWCSTNSSTPCAVGKIGVPLLVAAMGGNTSIRDNEMLYDMAASRDKDFIVVEGATHNLERCTECETRKGQYDNVTKNFFNYVAKWITTRF